MYSNHIIVIVLGRYREKVARVGHLSWRKQAEVDLWEGSNCRFLLKMNGIKARQLHGVEKNEKIACVRTKTIIYQEIIKRCSQISLSGLYVTIVG